jgi:hypothetical protein
MGKWRGGWVCMDSILKLDSKASVFIEATRVSIE